jgi:glutamine synthetase
VIDKGGYFDLTTLDVASDFRRDVVFTLRDLGIPVEYTHHEVGPSQHEIDMRFADGLEMADNTMTYRIAVKEVAAAHGYYATFMPKPLFGENGSGMHTHQSLFRGDENAFFDADDEYYLSSEAKGFIAGQLRHARELSALFAPSVNSYKRLVPGYEPRCTSAGRAATARRSCGCPSTTPAKTGPPAPSSGARTPRAIRTNVRGAAPRGARGHPAGL